MSVFLSVIFMCVGNQCQFLHSKETFFNLQECQALTIKAVVELKQAGVDSAYGDCLPIKESI